MKQLETNGYISRNSEGFISLTEAGLEIAEMIYERHGVLSEVFIALGVSEETAREDACRIEHYLSEETFECIKKHIKERSSK